MKKQIFRFVNWALAFSSIFFMALNSYGQPNFVIDNFNSKDSHIIYKPFGNEKVITQEGYGVYFKKAGVNLSHVKPNAEENALRIQFELPPHFSWGNWLSIRKEFNQFLNLKAYTGIEINLKVINPSNALLRITLSDVMSCKSAENYGSDEMWWFDFNPEILRSSVGWITIRAPFSSFYLSRGAGTRHNDRMMDLSKIIAYEINLISKKNDHPKGVILVNSLRAY